MHKRLETEALGVLRTCLDLAEVDMRPTADLLERLLDVDAARLAALTAQLRRTGFLQRDRYGLTMAGLVVAASMPVAEPAPMLARRGRAAFAA
ncbi:MAG: hypothetical protein AAF721_11950 [Myxococcota bacterium]